MDFPPLASEELRVLGSLVEKSITTPDYYPLSLNALTNACNQLTARDPVVSYDEATVLRTLDALREKRLATLYNAADSRVARYKHTLTDALLLTPAELAILCVLMLRGAQTVGELRTRTERLFRFDTLPEVEETLNALAARTPDPLVSKLPRQPGTKESRYTHLLGGPPAPAIVAAVNDSLRPAATAAPEPTPTLGPTDRERLDQLERELAALRAEFAEFRKQFE